MEEQKNVEGHKRKHYWINKKLQFSYMKLVLAGVFASAVLSAAIFGGGIYYLVKKAILFRLTDVMEQKLTTEIIFSDVDRFMLMWLPIVIVVLGGAFSIVSIFMSHRFAGPLVRLNKWMSSISNYDFSVPIKFRPKDDLKILEPSIEEVNTTISQALNEDKNLTNTISVKLGEISAKSSDVKIKELVDLVKKLKDNMDRYKMRNA